MQITAPFINQSDILIFGGGTSAVAAALAARKAGRRVVLATAYSYLGDDVCATMNYWGWGRSGAEATVAKDLFKSRDERGALPSPMQVKRTLEQALLAAGVDFLFMTYPVAALRDEQGALAGAVVANRSGFQAIRAGIVVDATPRAQFVRGFAPASFKPFAPGVYPGRRVAAGNDTAELARQPGTRAPGYFRAPDRDLLPYRWQLDCSFADATPAAMAKADVEARLATWFPGQLLGADRLDVPFADRLTAKSGRQETWKGVDAFNLSSLRVDDANLFVLSSMADVSDVVAEQLADPCAAMALGCRLGEQVANVSAPLSDNLTVDQTGLAPVADLDVVRADSYFRLHGKAGVALDLNRLPVLGEYDVVVAGGGTGGAPAGISAARAGAKTVILEYVPGLGGVGTEGRIASYYHGNRCGFTSEIDQGVAALGRSPDYRWDEGRWNTEWKKQWYLQAACDAGAEVWFHALSVAAAVDDDRVRGVVVATPYGYGLIKAGSVVDATGNADVAAAAGARTINISKAHVAVQGTGLSPFDPGRHYTNTDYTFVDDTDVVDVTRAFAVARGKFADAFDMGQIVDSRQRQQVEGELSLDPLDFLAERTFPDTVTTASSNFDSHGFTIHPVFMAKPPDHEELRAHIPFRCLIPKGLDGILVTGLGVSAHRDALPVIRMQPDVQNQGYAAGRAAAMAVAAGCPIREIDVKALQRHLVDKHILEPEVVDQVDSFPLPDEVVARSVTEGADDYLGLAVVFADPARSLPLLRHAYATSTGEAQLRYAHLLGLLGDPTGAKCLAAELDRREWDPGWNYRGMGQFGFSLSPVDSMLVALGRSGDLDAQPTLLRKIATLTSESEFSHLRAATLAFEAQPAKEAATEFARLLDGVWGNSTADIARSVAKSPQDRCDTSERNLELKELLLARGLYACGDSDGKAKAVLEAYANDLHGHYARHARALLDGRA